MPINGPNVSLFYLAFNIFRLDDRVDFIIVKWSEKLHVIKKMQKNPAKYCYFNNQYTNQ